MTEDPLRPGTIAATAAEIEAAGGRAVALACDHHDDAQVAEVFERIRKDERRLDVLVNNATADLSSMVGKRCTTIWNDAV